MSFGGLIGALRSRLRSKLVTPSLSEDDIKGLERRMARVKPATALQGAKIGSSLPQPSIELT